MQTGGAEADGASWKGSVSLEDMQGIQAVQRECKKGVKKGNSTEMNSGETPHKALTSLIKPVYLSFRYYPTTQYEPMHSSYDPLPASRPVSYLSLERKTEEQEQRCSGDVRCRNSDGTSTQPVGSGGGGIIAKAAAEDADT